MIHDHFQFITVDGVKEDDASIVRILAAIHQGKLANDLKLLNYYQEIPVSYGATLDEVNIDRAEVTVHQHQAVVMQGEKRAFLKSAHFPHDVVAKVLQVNVDKGFATLVDFAYVQIKAERRQFIRVKVQENIPITFEDAGGKISGRLFDISLGGLSILLAAPPDRDPGTRGMLTLTLGVSLIQVAGSLLKVLPEGGGQRCIFALEANSKAEGVISQFVFQRQLMIIRELKDRAL